MFSNSEYAQILRNLRTASNATLTVWKDLAREHARKNPCTASSAKKIISLIDQEIELRHDLLILDRRRAAKKGAKNV